jgi:hypothetical protein
MTRARSTLLAVSLGAVVCAALVACLDLTPLIYEAAPPEAGPHPTADAGPDVVQPGDAAADGDAVVDVDNRPPCVQCITAPDDASPPGCDTEIQACQDSPVCLQIYECALASGCFEQPSFRDLVNCGLPCAAEAGVVSSQDPSLLLVYNVAVCAQANCNAPCNIGDAAIP